MKAFSLFLSLFFFVCQAGSAQEAPAAISFLDPTSFNQKEGAYVELRGFYTEHSNGDCTLSAMPNLKSCCVGKTDLQHSQLLLKGEFGPLKKDRAISLRGYLYRNFNAISQHEPFYILHSSVENTPTESIAIPKKRSP